MTFSHYMSSVQSKRTLSFAWIQSVLSQLLLKHHNHIKDLLSVIVVRTQWADWSFRPSVRAQHVCCVVLALTRLHVDGIETGGCEGGLINLSQGLWENWVILTEHTHISDIQLLGNMSVNPGRSIRGLKPVMSDRGDMKWSVLFETDLHRPDRWKLLIPSIILLSKVSSRRLHVTEVSRKPKGTLTAQNESWAQSWDQVGHPRKRRPRHPTQGTTQVQAEADPSVQEQAPEEGNPGVCMTDEHRQRFRNDARFWFVISFSLQLWWWHPWYGGLRHRWVHLKV